MNRRRTREKPVMSANHYSAREQAVVWHVRLASETASEQDWLDFERWIGAPQNLAACAALDYALAIVEAQRHVIAEAMQGPRFSARGAPTIAAWMTASVGLAALLAVLVAPKPVELGFAAPITATRTVSLPDHSVVQLNRGAAVWARLDGRSRQLVLERGEAAFLVAHDAARPFTVAAGLATIRDVGTEFDVVRAASYAIVTVRAGRVDWIPLHGGEMSVGAGEQGRVDGSGRVASVAPANAEDAFGWQRGRLIYHDAPLSQIVEDLNRYSRTPVVIADHRAALLRFTGVLVIDKATTMLARLAAFLPVQFVEDRDRIELSMRP